MKSQSFKNLALNVYNMHTGLLSAVFVFCCVFEYFLSVTLLDHGAVPCAMANLLSILLTDSRRDDGALQHVSHLIESRIKYALPGSITDCKSIGT